MKLQIQLHADGSNESAKQFEIPIAGESVVIGRGPDSPVPLEGSKLSRNHVAFGVANGMLTLTDLSSNGVWVNAQSVPKKSAVALNGNEEIAIPGYRLRVRLLVPAPEPPEPESPPAAPETPRPALPRPADQPNPVPAATEPSVERSRTTAEIAEPESTLEYDDAVVADTPWWAMSTAEKVVLFFIALSATLFAYYYSLQ